MNQPQDMRALLPVEQIITNAERAQQLAVMRVWAVFGWASALALALALGLVLWMHP